VSIAEKIRQKLSSSLFPDFLEIIDESHKHAGHRENTANSESHFKLIIVSDHFANLSRLDRQKLVHNILKEELMTIHAISFKAITKDEFKKSHKGFS